MGMRNYPETGFWEVSLRRLLAICEMEMKAVSV